MDFTKLSVTGLLKLHSSVREALEHDDTLVLAGQQPTYGVRAFADWRQWADQIEAELDSRSVKYTKLTW